MARKLGRMSQTADRNTPTAAVATHHTMASTATRFPEYSRACTTVWMFLSTRRRPGMPMGGRSHAWDGRIWSISGSV